MKLKKWWVIALIMILPLLFIMGNLKKKTPIATSRMPKEMTAYSFTTSQTFFFVSTILIVTTVPFHRKN